MPITQLIPSFNAGELSPQLHFRSDLEKYRSGCKTLRNMLLTPYGGAKRRPGLAYTATAAGKCRLFNFQVSISQSFILELSAQQIRFFKRDQIVQAGGGGDLTVTTPYTDDDLFGIDIKQINNVAYFCHPDYPVYKLARIQDNNWVFAEVDFSYPAMLSENLDETLTIDSGLGGETGSIVTLTASGALFTSDQVGAYFQLRHERPKDQYELKLKGNAGTTTYSSEIILQGAYRFSTGGTWNGTFTIQRNEGSGWEDVAQYASASDANFDVERVQEGRARFRLGFVRISGGSSDSYALIDTAEPYITGLVKITSVNSPTVAAANVIYGIEGGSTEVWREGAWSNKQGYPRSICAHEQRLVFGGNTLNPQTIWASAVDDYENFEPGSDDDDSWSHVLVSGQQNDIQWMVSQKALLVGTTGDEWVLDSSKESGVITPTNVTARRHSGNGSDNVSPLLLDDSSIFVQRGGRVVRKMGYSFESDGYKTDDLTLLAEHITGLGITQLALQSQPDQVIWAVTEDGRLLGLTFDDSQNISGWHRHTTEAAGAFESVAVRKVQGEDDQIWVVVRRIINGTTVRYIERLKPDGFFLEEPWNLQYQDTYSMTPWALYTLPTTENTWQAVNNTWAIGDVVYRRQLSATGEEDWDAPFVADYSPGTYFQTMWLCVVPHDTDQSSDWYASDNDLLPIIRDISGNPAHEWHSVDSWQYAGIGTNYTDTDPDYVYNSATEKIYRCILNHTSSAADEPGVGGSWATYWAEVQDYGTPIHYSPSSPIYLNGGADVQYNGAVWSPVQDRPARLNNAPAAGIGAWDENPLAYLLDSEVVHNNVPYKCILGHTATASTEPGIGGTWETSWETIQTDYNAGELVSEGSINYKCILTHTPSADKRPGIGASWATYWELLTDEENLDYYVDAGVTLINPGAITEVTGLSHLEGETVQVFANGAVLKDREVSSGAIQLDQDGDPVTYTHISVGLAFNSLLEPMYMEAGMQNGSSAGREKRISDLILFFQDSYSCLIGATEGGSFDRVRFYDGESVTPQLYSGEKECRLDSNTSRKASFVLKQDLPMPFHILAIVCKYEIRGDQN